jgi:C1A family cysteine protease
MNRIILVIALFAFAAFTNANRVDSLATLWSTWKTQHNKIYSVSEELTRFGIFVENLEKIVKLNAEHEHAKFGINKFSDLTSTEFGAIYASGAEFVDHNEPTYTPEAIELPDSVDWRTKGAVTHVKDQGQCGSCWSFSATGVIEGTYFIHNGKLLSLSEQQIVDCAHSAGHGCQGGWPYLAVTYAAQNGLESESDYPYTARDGSCKYNSGKAIKVTSGYKFITTKSSDLLKTALVNSPVSVLVQADQSSFQHYKSGVLATGCGAAINHAVLAVGYKKIGALEAFIVKNSWGTGWGDNGYIHLSTVQQINNGQGICGVLVQPMISA